MDFQSLLRRDLQFLCKKNKIPANMTNVAMADALKALEIVEGLDEYMYQLEQSPISVAKQPSKTATRTTRRTTTVKAEPKPSSRLVSHSTSKSLAEEMDQENINKTVAQEAKTNSVKFEANVPKTPAARCARKASAATSCTKKEEMDQEGINKTVAQEPKTNSVKFEANVSKTPAARSTRKASAATSCAKKDELVQSVYSTRRSTRLLEKCMADLSLKTGETSDKPEKSEDTEHKVSTHEKSPAGSKTEVIPGRDLSDSMEQWENLKNESDQIVEDLEVDVDIAVVETNTVKNKEVMNEDMADNKKSENSLVHKDEDQEETMVDQTDSDAGDSETKQAIQQNDSEPEKSSNIDEDNQTGNDADIAVMDTNTERDMEEMIEVEADEEESETSLVHKVDDQEETKADQIDSDADDSETKQAIQQNVSEPEKSSNIDEDNQTGNDAGIAVMDTITERNMEVLDEVKADGKASENSVVQADAQEVPLQANHEEGLKKIDNGDSPLLEYANTKSHNDLALDGLVLGEEQETEQAVKEDDSELDTMMDQTDSDDGDSETEPEEDNCSNDSDDTISETDSNQADQMVEDLKVRLDVIAVLDTKPERNKEEMNEEVTADVKESENGLVQEEAFHAEKHDNGDSPVLEYAYTDIHDDLALDSFVQVNEQKTEQTVQENDFEFEKINVEETTVDQTNTDPTDSQTEKAILQNDTEPEKTEPEEEEDNSGDDDSEDTISEADSNQAVLGSDIAYEEMTLSESEGYTATTDAPKSPPHLEVAKDIKTTDEEMTLSESERSTATTDAPKSPPVLEVAKDIKTTSEISYQFPRPTKSTTTPLKSSSGMKVVNENKENNMEMMKCEEGKMKKKKVTKIDEENLKDMSMRQLEKMLKELSIKNNRTALKILPGTNNQTAK